MASVIALEQKIKLWIEKNPQYKKYEKNMPLAYELYMQNNIIENVSDCDEGMNAKLTLMITKDLERRPLRLCSSCNRKTCDADSCGAEDYEDKFPRAYSGIDMNIEMETLDKDEAKRHKITVSVSPFVDDIPKLDVNHAYIIEGQIRSFKDKLEINVQKVSNIGEELGEETTGSVGEDVAEKLSEIMDLYTNKVPVDKWKNWISIKNLKEESVKTFCEANSIKEIDGYMVK